LKPTKTTGKSETVLSTAVLGLLIAVSVFVFQRQFSFNPAVLTTTDQGVAVTAGGSSGESRSVSAIVPLPDSVVPLSPPERFDAATLSDKIDGKAELYLAAGFQRLETQRFRAQEADSAWMELFLYDMGNSENAFAVYSSQQRDNARPLDVSRFAYRTANALYWVHGPYYAELIGSQTSDAAMQAMQAVARSMTAGRKVETAAVDLPEIFPAEGRLEDGVTLIPSDAFGFSKLDRVYTAEYELAQGAFTAFLSDRGSAAAAAAAAQDYRSFLEQFGGRRLESPTDGDMPSNLAIVEILGSYEVIFSRGRFMAGVHEAPATEPALELAKTLKTRIDEFIQSQTR